MTAARRTSAGWRSSGYRAASSGVSSRPITSPSRSAYGRAAATRSCARLSLDVATISIVRVILRVFWTERMRPFSSLALAMIYRCRKFQAPSPES
jgi:hypothetical protein